MRGLRTLLEVAVALAAALAVSRWVLSIFRRKTTVYRPTTVQQLSLLTWPLLAVGAGLAATGPNLLAGSPAERWLAWGTLAAVLALAAPALLLHLRYYQLNAGTVLYFDPKAGRLQVTLHGMLAYDAALGWPGPGPVVWGRCRWPGVFWRRYEYLRLPLPQGDVVLTALLLPDMRPLASYLREFGVVVQERQQGWTWV